MSVRLTDVRAAQPSWFSRGNKAFFNDVRYWILHGRASRKPYLVRSTFAMFGAPRRLEYRINGLDENLMIQNLFDESFCTLDDVKDWMKEN